MKPQEALFLPVTTRLSKKCNSIVLQGILPVLEWSCELGEDASEPLTVIRASLAQQGYLPQLTKVARPCRASVVLMREDFLSARPQAPLSRSGPGS
jgi:hypothetical protein